MNGNRYVLRDLLLEKFREIQRKNPKYSKRGFAKKLGLSAGAISEIFLGRRGISKPRAMRIIDRLDLDPQERAEFIVEFEKPDTVPSDASENELDYIQLSEDQFKCICDLHHFTMLALMRTRDFRGDLGYVAKRLKISRAQCEEAFERLQRLGLIHTDALGAWKRSKSHYRTSDDVMNASIQFAHRQNLTRAREALDTLTVTERDFSSIMLSMNAHHLPRVKEMIRKFQDEVAKEVETAPGEEVFQLFVQVFPLTHPADPTKVIPA